MKNTGLEIVEMIARGEAPKKIKINGNTYEFQKEFLFYQNENMNCIDLIKCLNEEFEIIEDESKVWKPKEDEEYHYISDDGNIITTKWKNTIIDRLRYEVGNCYKTFEEVKKVLEKLKIYTQLKRYAEEHNEEKIDWENEKQNKWTIYFQCGDLEITQDWSIREMAGVYFTSEELCRRAIQDIGEENIKKLFEEE